MIWLHCMINEFLCRGFPNTTWTIGELWKSPTNELTIQWRVSSASSEAAWDLPGWDKRVAGVELKPWDHRDGILLTEHREKMLPLEDVSLQLPCPVLCPASLSEGADGWRGARVPHCPGDPSGSTGSVMLWKQQAGKAHCSCVSCLGLFSTMLTCLRRATPVSRGKPFHNSFRNLTF